jgi:hypothetical protein
VSTHSCYGCRLKVHSALWCGKRLDTLLNEKPYLVGRALPGGRVLHDIGADNEMHCVCFTCIGKLPAGYDEDSNNEGKGTLRNTDSEEESSSDEGGGEVGGPPAGGKQLNRGKVLPRRNTSAEVDKDSDEGGGEVGGPPGGNQLNAATGKQLIRGKVLPRRNTDSEEEEEETSPQINQTREIGKEDIEFPIALVPMLQLHAPIPNTDGQDEGTLHFSPTNTIACDFNCRKVNMSRMNCIDPRDNMVKRLRREKEKPVPSVADGRIVVVVTSFINLRVGHRGSLPMRSVAFPEEKAKCHAVPLTTNILQTAISFLEGRKEEEEEEEEEEEDEEEDKEEKEKEKEKEEKEKEEEKEEEEEEEEDEEEEEEEEEESGNQVIEDFKQVMDKFRVYLQLLVEKMPKNMAFDDLKAFINDRDWPDGSWGLGRCKELLESQGAVTVDDAYFLRRFIHENLARATKIVVHVVDGIHRVTAIDFTLIGWHSPNDVDEKVAIEKYWGLLPHQDKMIPMATYIPQVIDQPLLQDMKYLSSQIQQIASLQVPHNLRDIIANEIMRLTKTCDDDHTPYLWDCLGVVYKVLAGKSVTGEDIQVMTNGIHPNSPDGQGLLTEIADLLASPTKEDLSKFLDRYIQVWVENMAMKIMSQLKTSTHKIFLHMQSIQDTEGDSDFYGKNLFQIKKKGGGNVVSHQYNIFQCHQMAMQTKKFFDENSHDLVKATGTVDGFKSVFSKDRFSKKPHTDVEFVVSQVLIFARTCEKTELELIGLFSSLHPTQLQYCPGSYDDAYRWTMNYFTNMCGSTYASYPPWKNGFFLPDDKHPIQCNPGQVVYLCLLGSAIEENTKFFNKMGMKTVWSNESLIPLRDTLSARQHEGDKTVPDLLTMITLSHNMRMNCRIKQQNTKKIERDRLSRSNNMVEIRWKKNQHASLLAELSIDGNSTADPRSKEGKPLIGIVSNSQKIDKNDEETLFTAKIEDHHQLLLNRDDTIFADVFRDHHQLLLNRDDTIFADVFRSDVGDSLSVDGDADDVDDSMSAENDEGVTGDDDDNEEGGGEEEVLVEEERSSEEEEEPGRGRGGEGRGTRGKGK